MPSSTHLRVAAATAPGASHRHRRDEQDRNNQSPHSVPDEFQITMERLHSDFLTGCP